MPYFYIKSQRASQIYCEMNSPPLLRTSTMRLAKNVKSKKLLAAEFYNGTFAQFGLPGPHDLDDQGVRDVLWLPASASRADCCRCNSTSKYQDSGYKTNNNVSNGNNIHGNTAPAADDDADGRRRYKKHRHLTDNASGGDDDEGTLWVANEFEDEVVVFDVCSGNVSFILNVPRPISLLQHKSLLFVSSKSHKSRKLAGAVYAFDLMSPQLNVSIRGLVYRNNYLFILRILFFLEIDFSITELN